MEKFINKIINDSCLSGLKNIPNNSIDCCVTSPPYFGLRDYGVEGQIVFIRTDPEQSENIITSIIVYHDGHQYEIERNGFYNRVSDFQITSERDQNKVLGIDKRDPVKA